jgi:uncharacterized membrane protein
MKKENKMNWNNEPRQDFTTQREYSGYTGNYEQSSQMFEQQQAQQQEAYRPEFQSAQMNGQVPGYSPLFSAAQPLDGARLGAALSYGLGWLSGLLFFLFAGENRYIRFHALQSIAFFGAINLLDMIVPLLWIGMRGVHAPWLFLLSFFFLMIVNLIGFVGWLVGIIQAGRGTYYKLPFVGEYVTRRMNWNTIK